MGGPVFRERLWFFGATRIKKEETARSTAFTLIPYIRTNDEKRYEGKLTFTPRANHSVQASYTAIDQVQTKFTSQVILDMESLGVQRQPSDLLSVRYSGIVSPNLSVELQYSSRHLSINTGATMRDRIRGTLLIDSSRNARYWSPTFCAVCGDEKRDNDDVLGKVSYFLSTRAFGAHHLVAGYDRFNDKIFQNAYASGSDYRIQGTSSIIVGTSVFPQFLPNSTLIMHTPVDQSTLGSDLRMHSVFFNDGWRLNDHISFNLGVRWDKNQAQDGGGAVVANKGLWSPRARGHLGSEGGRPVGAQCELRAVRDADDEQRRRVDDRRGKCVDARLALSGARHQSRSERATAGDERRRDRARVPMV